MGSSPIPATRPVGQAVKTPPFHGGNSSSILLRVTNKKAAFEPCSNAVFLYPSRRLGMESRASVHGIAIGVWHHLRCISCGLIPYATSSQFHSATSCGFHPRLRRDLDEKGERYGKEFIAWIFRKIGLRNCSALQRAQNRLQYRISNQKIIIKCFRQHFRSSISSKSCRYAFKVWNCTKRVYWNRKLAQIDFFVRMHWRRNL